MSEGIELSEAEIAELPEPWKKKYHGKWIAYDSEFGMICAYKDIEKVREKAREFGFPHPPFVECFSEKRNSF